ncbi:MAG: electron transport complex subunit RsxC [Clostridia bacterium]|nr:electron transport complex subunit RsxC [Clostridia bacterium]
MKLLFERKVLLLPKRTFRGGIHPLGSSGGSKKPTKGKKIVEFTPESVVIPMAMHMGAPSKPIVKKGDKVKKGQLIGEPVGFLGVAVHSSVSGEVIAIEKRMQLGATQCDCVVINNDFADDWVELSGHGNVEACDPDVVVPSVKEAGICGEGGAAFPTHIKLSVPSGKKCDTVIINGAECETYMTCDHRLMLEEPGRIIDGLRAVMRAVDAQKGIIAIEDNKRDAIAAMRETARGRIGVSVEVLKAKYPQGSEKQIIQAVCGREVPTGGLPIDVGAIVLNASTAASIADAVIYGIPLISRVVTVTGSVKSPANLRVPIGTIVEDMVSACDGYVTDPKKIIMGGAMTGLCAYDHSVSVTKGTGGVVIFDEHMPEHREESPCIRCGKCVDVCPVRLNPYLIRKYIDKNDLKAAEDEHVMDCLLCGSCSYACPSYRFLNGFFKIAKERIAKARKG